MLWQTRQGSYSRGTQGAKIGPAMVWGLTQDVLWMLRAYTGSAQALIRHTDPGLGMLRLSSGLLTLGSG